MKKSLWISFLCVVSLSSLVFSATQWQSTRLSKRTGQCQLESNNIRVKVNGFHLDVEEEAVISTLGDANGGEPNTLEIFGNFKLSNGAALRSLLLWNGNKLLKAKLIDRNKADSIFNDIVDYSYRDPAIIKYLGNNSYSFRIYPVAINKSRKIRILYSIPLQIKPTGVQFELIPAFTLGASVVPTHIPVEFVRAGTDSIKYILQHGTTKKTIEFKSTYLVPFADFCKGSYYYGSPNPAPILISPDSTVLSSAYTQYQDSTTSAPGYYSLMFSSVPDTVKGLITELVLQGYTIETKIETSDKIYRFDIKPTSFFGIYLKSQSAWEGDISWNVYDKAGALAFTYLQTLAINADSINAALPLLWGAKYTFIEKYGNLGSVFGFVDTRMSLLAIERDTLTTAETAMWWEQGVPPLLPSEIIPDPSALSPLPKENIIIDMTGNKVVVQKKIENFQIVLKRDNQLQINLSKAAVKSLTVELLDMRGRIIKSYKKLSMHGNGVLIDLPKNLNGAYIVRMLVDDATFTKRIILK